VVIGETQKETKPVLTAKAAQMQSPIYFADKQMPRLHYATGLAGPYQLKNITTALMAVNVLRRQEVHITGKAITQGLKNVVKNTAFMGRWMMMGKRPLIIFDSAHNEGGLRQLVKSLKDYKYNRLHFVYGTVGDKDITQNLNLLPKKAVYYFCKANLPRAMDATVLKNMAAANKLTGDSYTSVKQAYQAALKNAGKADLVLVAGSVFVVAEVL
jgi:dihydrofolate synthase/folylpolyglutamate synthase